MRAALLLRTVLLLLPLALFGCSDGEDSRSGTAPAAVEKVHVSKRTVPVFISWLHDGANTVHYIVYRAPKDGSAPMTEIARVPVGGAGQKAYLVRDAEVADASLHRYGVAVAGSAHVTETTLHDESAVAAAAASCQVQDISFEDSDGDGIPNTVEFEGWQIYVAPLTASPSGIGNQLQRDKPVLKSVSSSIFYDDTDGDGLCDWQEHGQASTDPDNADTDNDGLGDRDEVVTWNSNPNDPDSDDDAFAPVLALTNGQQQVQYVTLASADPALLDGREVCASAGFTCNFKTSPTLADTDGDSYTDYAEIIQLGSQFNPLVANLPLLELSLVGTANLSVTITFSDSTTQAQTKSSSLAQGQSSTDQRYASTVRKTWDKFGQSLSTDIGAGPLPKGASYNVNVTASFEEGTATTQTSGWSKATTTQSQQTYNDAVQTARQQGSQISGGAIAMGVQIVNTGSVTYNLTDLNVTALRRLPAQNSFEAIGTMLLASPLGSDGISLAPGGSTGVLQVKTDATANKVLDLMADPASLYFSIASFKINNSQKVDFNFIEQVTNAQTGLVLIDFGSGGVFSKRVATNVARTAGKITGIRVADALTTLGIAYETTNRVINGQTVTVLTGVQDPSTGQFVRVDDGNNRFWAAMRTADQVGLVPQNFEDLVLPAGQAIYLLYVTDGDRDGVFLRDEILYGTSDANPDSDGDGLSDFDEIVTGWQVSANLPPRYPAQVFSDPTAADADNDGFSDQQEKALGTDPNSPDTDGDLLCDGNGSSVNATGICTAGVTPDAQPLAARFAFIGATPAPYVINAAANAAIAVDFSIPVKANSSLSVRSLTRGPVSGSVAFSNGGRTMTFTPQQAFQPNEVIEVSLLGETSEATGARLPDYHYRFQVATPAGTGFDDAPRAEFSLSPSSLLRVTSMISGDFNQDNLSDIAITAYIDNGIFGTADDSVYIAFNSGSGDFVPVVAFPVVAGSAPQALVAGDFNGDGRLDLATANPKTGHVNLLLASSTQGQFSLQSPVATGAGPVGIATGDFNGDGHLDLVTANRDAGSNSVLLGRGDGSFAPAVSLPSGATPRAVAVADLDNDGFLDVITAFGTAGNGGLYVNLGNGDGSFRQTGIAQPFTASGFPAAIAIGDFNGDGLPDVVTANQDSNDVSLLLNNGNGVFTAQPNTPVVAQPTAIIAADFNGDGKLDLATSGSASTQATASVLYAQQNVGSFERQDLDNLAMQGTALVADLFVPGPPAQPLMLVIGGQGSPSGYQVQPVEQLQP